MALSFLIPLGLIVVVAGVLLYLATSHNKPAKVAITTDRAPEVAMEIIPNVHRIPGLRGVNVYLRTTSPPKCNRQ